MKNLPFHCKPRSGQSSGETGIILKADAMSTLAGLLFDEPNSILYSFVFTFTKEPSTLKEPKIMPSAAPILLFITAGNSTADIKLVTPLYRYAGKPLRRYGKRL